MIRIVTAVLALGLAAVLSGYGYRAFVAAAPHDAAETPEQMPAVDSQAAGNAPWVCPMHLHIVQDHPGSCPICGMDLVVADSGNAPSDAGVHIDTATTQKMGVRLIQAQEQALSREIHTLGEIRIDPSSTLEITPKTDGWIRKSHVTHIGQYVRKGDVLYEFYSPDLVQRQREYIELLQRRDQLLASMTTVAGQNAQVLASLARERIRLRDRFIYADVDRALLDSIESTRRTVDVMPMRAPASGHVTQINARSGNYVAPSAALFSIADLATVWLDITLYPDQFAWVQVGDPVRLKSPADGRTLGDGRVEFISPAVERASQAKTARITLDNPGIALNPGMFVDAIITTEPRTVLTLPRTSILRSGRGDRVMLSRGQGHFMPVPVVIGLEAGDWVEISDGLQEGAEVAVNGQFLLDAAASLNDTLQRMQGAD